MQNSQLKEEEKLEYISCYLCGKDTHKTIITSYARIASASTSFASSDQESNNIFRLVKCNNCGCIILIPDLRSNTLDTIIQKAIMRIIP